MHRGRDVLECPSTRRDWVRSTVMISFSPTPPCPLRVSWDGHLSPFRRTSSTGNPTWERRISGVPGSAWSGRPYTVLEASTGVKGRSEFSGPGPVVGRVGVVVGGVTSLEGLSGTLLDGGSPFSGKGSRGRPFTPLFPAVR